MVTNGWLRRSDRRVDRSGDTCLRVRDLEIDACPVRALGRNLEDPSSPVHTLSRPVARELYRRADALLTYGTHVSDFVAAESGRAARVFVAPQCVESDRFRHPRHRGGASRPFGGSSDWEASRRSSSLDGSPGRRGSLPPPGMCIGADRPQTRRRRRRPCWRRSPGTGALSRHRRTRCLHGIRRAKRAPRGHARVRCARASFRHYETIERNVGAGRQRGDECQPPCHRHRRSRRRRRRSRCQWPDGAGLPERNAAALATAIDDLLTDLERARSIGAEASRVVRRFDFASAADPSRQPWQRPEIRRPASTLPHEGLIAHNCYGVVRGIDVRLLEASSLPIASTIASSQVVLPGQSGNVIRDLEREAVFMSHPGDRLEPGVVGVGIELPSIVDQDNHCSRAGRTHRVRA